MNSIVRWTTRLLLLLPLSSRAFVAVGVPLRNKKSFHSTSLMPRGVKKEHLPSKVCVTCERPFTWRKKWERCWDEVTTCSKSCNSKRRSGNRAVLDDDDDDDDDEGDRSILTDTKKVKKNNARNSIADTTTKLNMNNKQGAPIPIIGGRADSEELDASLDQGDSFDMHEELDVSILEELYEDADSEDDDGGIIVIRDQSTKEKAERKAAKKVKKAERRAQRQGNGDPRAGQKPCDLCSKSVNLLVRCTYDESLQWKMVCGKCWKDASGGVVDGDGSHPFYRYGGLWKNRRAS
jgi:hypothetical protein